MKVSVIVVAAGKGERFGAKDVPKAFYPLMDKPLLAHVLSAFQTAKSVEEIIVALRVEMMGKGWEETMGAFNFSKLKALTEGGVTREDSVWNALQKISKDCDIVLIHDAARPLIQQGLVEKIIQTAEKCGAAIPGLKVKPTLKEVNSEGLIARTHDREHLWEAQTPQGFRMDLLRKAFEAAGEKRAQATDEACLLEWALIPVKMIEGDEENIKITTRDDLIRAEFLIRRSGLAHTHD